jgi:Chaperone of endosialidase
MIKRINIALAVLGAVILWVSYATSLKGQYLPPAAPIHNPTFTGTVFLNSLNTTSGDTTLTVGSGGASGLLRIVFDFFNSGQVGVALSNGGVTASSVGCFNITSGGATGTVDTAICRDSIAGAGFVDCGNGSANSKSCTMSLAALIASGTIQQGTEKSCATGLTTDSSGNINGCVASDERLKTNLTALTRNGAIMKLKPRLYNWKPEAKHDTRKHAGFVAQEVRQVFPEAVADAGNGYLGVDSNAILAELIAEFQEYVRTHP